MKEYDIVVIGAGVGGYTAAETAAKGGLKTALIEKDLIGGTCLNRGCIPTKAYLYAAKQYRELLNCNQFGISVSKGPDISREHLHRYLEKTVEGLRNALTSRLISAQIDLYSGEALLEAGGIIALRSESNNLCMKAKYIILATGSCPILPAVPGIDLKNVITSDQMFMKEHLIPESIVIVGGGVIGIETAFLLNQFGAQVTLIEQQECILGNLSKEVSRMVERHLESLGVIINVNTTLASIEEADDELVVTVVHNEIRKKIITEKTLIAIGRKASYNADNMRYIGINIENDKIVVDRHYETSVKGIFAVGDVADQYQLAHAAAAEGTKVVDYILDKAENTELQYIPQCIYITPEVATVGESEDSALQKGLDIQIGYAKMSANGKAVLENHSNGLVKIIVDKERQCLIGAELFCENAVDMLGILEVCVVNAISIQDLKECVFPHPSYSEAIKEALENIQDRVI